MPDNYLQALFCINGDGEWEMGAENGNKNISLVEKDFPHCQNSIQNTFWAILI